jgi:hypothetical protein
LRSSDRDSARRGRRAQRITQAHVDRLPVDRPAGDLLDLDLDDPRLLEFLGLRPSRPARLAQG